LESQWARHVQQNVESVTDSCMSALQSIVQN
jgi:hypothetical protein